jgi:tetratricopeptide (TPR) repeat protein
LEYTAAIQLCALLFGGKRHTAFAVGFAAVFEQRIVRLARDVEHERQIRHLTRRQVGTDPLDAFHRIERSISECHQYGTHDGEKSVARRDANQPLESTASFNDSTAPIVRLGKSCIGKHKDVWDDKLVHDVGADEQIQVYDAYGRAYSMSKETWRTNVLPGTLRDSWNDAERLYAVVAQTLEDGFPRDVLDAARRVYSLKPSAGNACLYGIALLKNGQLEQAEHLLRTHTNQYGENGYVLTNLAKVLDEKGEDQKVDNILGRALELDPNQSNGLSCYALRVRERDGAAAEHAALVYIAQTPGSWLPQVLLALDELRSGNADRATEYYKEALHNAGNPAPTELLMSASEELGKQGRLQELLDLIGPRFVPAVHGLRVGNNLMQAHAELGQFDATRKILNALYALRRPDWREALADWDRRISKALTEGRTFAEADVKTIVLRLDGPIWLSSASLARSLFPETSNQAPQIAFVGSTAERSNSQAFKVQHADAPGRMSRSLPLFEAEQVHMATGASVLTLVPWVTAPSPAFVLGGKSWSDEWAANAIKAANPQVSFIVTLHLVAKGEEWRAMLRVIRVADAICVGTHDAPILHDRPERDVLDLTQKTLEILSSAAKLSRRDLPGAYVVPRGDDFASYLLRLEQLLAVRCASMDNVGKTFLHSPREILDGNIALCLQHRTNPLTRILLAETAAKMDRCLPQVVSEYRERIELLQRDSPLAGAPGQVLEQMFAAIPSLD